MMRGFCDCLGGVGWVAIKVLSDNFNNLVLQFLIQINMAN